jgi:hypothetical protein
MLLIIDLYRQIILGSLPGTAAAHELVISIRRKCTPEEVLNVLNTLPGLRENEETNNYNPLKIDVFVQTLLNLGSKSFSHSFAAIVKFHYVFKVSQYYNLWFIYIYIRIYMFFMNIFIFRYWLKQKKHRYAY